MTKPTINVNLNFEINSVRVLVDVLDALENRDAIVGFSSVVSERAEAKPEKLALDSKDDHNLTTRALPSTSSCK